MSKPHSNPTYSLKVILVGSSGVGKTSLVSSYFENPFDVQALPTVAPASCNATINLPGNVRVELQIWDTAGQERFQAISQMFYRDSHIAFVCYDSTTEDTVSSWIERVRSEVQDCIIFLVTTKADLLSDAETNNVRNRGVELKEEHEAHCHFLTSSSKRMGVNDLFQEAARCYNLVYQSNQPTIDIGSPNSKSNGGSGCC